MHVLESNGRKFISTWYYIVFVINRKVGVLLKNIILICSRMWQASEVLFFPYKRKNRRYQDYKKQQNVQQALHKA